MKVCAVALVLACLLAGGWAQARKPQLKNADAVEDGGPDPLRDELVRDEQMVADAQEQKNANVLRQALADDFLYVAYNGLVFTKPQIVKDLKYMDVSRYRMQNFKVRRLGSAAALLAYDLDIGGSIAGQDMPAKQYASSIWMNRSGRWVLIFHQETPANHG